MGIKGNKAASTASTFGVSLDELIGYTTAKIYGIHDSDIMSKPL